MNNSTAWGFGALGLFLIIVLGVFVGGLGVERWKEGDRVEINFHKGSIPPEAFKKSTSDSDNNDTTKRGWVNEDPSVVRAQTVEESINHISLGDRLK